MVPAWSRGEESCEMLSPRQLKLPVLGLGGTVATDADGVDGEVVVVHSWDELKSKSSQIKGKIVLYNVPFTEYGKTVQYRVRGAIEASRHGAIGSLLRSVGPFGIQTPHTGSMGYNDSFPKTPHGAITLEHAEMIDRIISRGETVRVRLKTSGKWLEDSPSSNVLCELTGSEKPNEVVVIGGHIDSWDVGSGAMDDGGGCMISWRALEILKELGLKPRRTIRCVFWTNEENGLRGGNAYAKAHETEKHVAAIESDNGVFEPIGFGVEGSDKEIEFLRTLSPLFQSLFSNGKSLEIKKGGGGADISPLTAKGVPSLGLNVDETKYFWYHHTEGDTPDKLIPEEMNRCVATMAIMAYLLADMPTVFGR